MAQTIAAFLPKTQSVMLRAVIVLLAGYACLLAAPSAAGALVRLAGGDPFAALPLAVAVALLYFAHGLWSLRPWARSVAKFFIGFLIVVGIAGVFNPFYVSDYAAEHGGATPDWMPIVAVMAPLVLLGLFCFWALDRHRGEFRPRPGAKG